MDCFTFDHIANIFLAADSGVMWMLQDFANGILAFGFPQGEEAIFTYDPEQDLFCLEAMGVLG